ncbi:MAG: U32 family peptidase [Clostridiaceae bacterium]|nr:U32 family peptidase [Clostridiaceae bacterium]
MKKPEILAPAGDYEKLRYAVAYGADAVYMSGKAYGMRTASGNFDPSELRLAIEHCHKNGVRCFITVNVMPRNNEIDQLPEYIEMLGDIGADAVIVADIGVIPLVKKYAPNVKLHISTQASVVNYSSASMFYNMGADRIVLARELSLEDIAEIRLRTPKKLEIETFVHGAMCISYSGRCLLSNFMAGRDANHGNCAQPCRWSYSLMEEQRPGEYYPVYEDERGTYIFNSKDMCLIDHIPELAAAGIDSFKIEGRVKSSYYAAVITGAYRRALDLYIKDGDSYKLPEAIRDEVFKVSHRNYYTGFYFGEGKSEYYEESAYIRNWDVCAMVSGVCESGLVKAVQKNKCSLGESVQLLSPGKDPVDFVITEMYDRDMNPIESAPHAHMELYMRAPEGAGDMSIIRKKKTSL